MNDMTGQNSRETLELHRIPRLEIPKNKDCPLSLEEIHRARHMRIIKAATSTDTPQISDLFQYLDLEAQYSKTSTVNVRDKMHKKYSLPFIGKLRTLVFQLGLTKMLLAGDWTINRQKEIPESMAVIPFEKLMGLVGEFRKKHEPHNERELIALDLGCGNGEFISYLRSEIASSDINQCETPNNEKWEIFGYADKIYFTVNSLLKNLLKSEFTEDGTLNEFIDVITTLLIRKIQNIKTGSGRRDKNAEILLKLPENLELIREVLHYLKRYIDIEGIKEMEIDQEYLCNGVRKIPDSVSGLIEEYCKSPELFIHKYFDDALKDLDPKQKTRIAQIEDEIKKIKVKDKPITLVGALQECEEKKQIQALEYEKAGILSAILPLSNFISLYPQNIVIGDFKAMDEIFRPGTVNFGWSFRATSHLDDTSYEEVIEKAALSLAPGGIFLDDGKRESWTRHERFEVLKRAQDKLGSDYRFKVICNGQRTHALIIERAVINTDGSKVFFSDEYGSEMLKDGAEALDTGSFELENPRAVVRNNVISLLRKKLVTSTPQGLQRRMDFRDVHPVIENVIDENLNGGRLSDCDIFRISEEIEKKVTALLNEKNSSLIKERLNDYAEPLTENESFIQTVPLRVAEGHTKYPMINNRKIIPVSLLPRNMELPSIEDLSYKVREFYGLLKEIKDAMKTPPITIVEFDSCFTNSLLLDALREILNEQCFINYTDVSEFARVENFALGNSDKDDYSSLVKNGSPLMIFGGSEANASDPHGRRFIESVCMPLIDDIESGYNKRALGVCFGSQVILEAYGRLKNVQITTIPGALKFGAFPVVFPESQFNVLQELSGGIYTMGLTHGWYSDCTGKRPADMKPFAFEACVSGNKLAADSKLPPLGFSLLDDKIITTQFHPELQLSRAGDNNALIQWLETNYGELLRKYEADGIRNPRRFFNGNFTPCGIGEKGIVPWVKRDAGLLFLLNVLLKQARGCVETMYGF